MPVTVFDSPIPAERGMPPEIAPPEGDQVPPQVTLRGGVTPPTTEPTGGEGVSVLRPGTDGAVRVIFDQDGAGDGAPANGDAPDGEQAAWQQERDRRFRQAPEAPEIPGAEQASRGPLEPIPAPNTALQEGVSFRHLDKMTGQVQTRTIAVGTDVQIGRLLIRAEACRAVESGVQHGTVAFLKIWDIRQPEQPAFSGWMFAESPALSAMDHPRYDVWVLGCTDGAASEN